MSENEDYLDRLLKQASTIDNPDSALSRVMDITRKVNEEKEKESDELSDSDDSASMDNNDIISGGDIASPDFGVLNDDVTIEAPEILGDLDNSLTPMSNDDVSVLLASMEETKPLEETVNSVKSIVEPASETETELTSEINPADAMKPMSQDDIAALLASMGDTTPTETVVSADETVSLESMVTSEEHITEEPSATEDITADPIPESVIEKETDKVEAPEINSTDAMKPMSQDDIAALLASMGDTAATEEAVSSEETISIEDSISESAIESEDVQTSVINPADAMNPMSDDDIAALFASMKDSAPAEETASVEETVLSEEPIVMETSVTEEPVVDRASEPVIETEPISAPEINPADAMKPMSDDDIAALFASMGNSDSDSKTSGDESASDISDLFSDSIVFENEDSILPESAESIAESWDETPSAIDDLLNSDFSGEIEIPDDNDGIHSIAGSDSEVGPMNDGNDISSLLSELSTEEKTIEPIEGLEDSDFSESDIEELLDKASDVKKNEIQEELEIDLSDMEAFEREFGIYDKNEVTASEKSTDSIETIDLGEDSFDISSVLNGDESEPKETDIDSLLDAAFTETLEEENAVENEETKSESDSKKKKKEKKKKEKKKKKDQNKDENQPEGEVTKKEKSKLAKFFEFLSKEEEPETDLINAQPVEGDTEGGTGENKEILDEIDSETEEKGKKKKKKKSKKDKKNDKKEETDDDLGEEDGEEDKKKKAKKPKKEKKERKPLALDIDTGKPLSKRNVILIFVLCLSIMGAIILVIYLIPPMLKNKQARDAFYREEYETTYQTFLGEELSDSDQILFDSAEIILKLQHKYDAYIAYNNMGMRLEALDQLLQAVSNYNSWAVVADSHGVRKQFDAVYSKIIRKLHDDFGLTQADCIDIISLPTDLEYTFKCYSIVTGTAYIDYSAPVKEFTAPEDSNDRESELKDELSEEGN